MWGRAAHSLYFTLIPEMGIVGTLLFLGMLRANYKDHRYLCSLEKRKIDLLAASTLDQKKKEKIKKSIRMLYFFSKAYTGAMIAYLVTGIFISVLWYNYFWALSSFWVATTNIARKTENLLISTQATQLTQQTQLTQ